MLTPNMYKQDGSVTATECSQKALMDVKPEIISCKPCSEKYDGLRVYTYEHSFPSIVCIPLHFTLAMSEFMLIMSRELFTSD